MGTKNNPGSFDCYAAAEPDEEMFVLLARDRLAPGIVEMWAALRSGDPYLAIRVFNELADTALNHYNIDNDRDKIAEAENCADNMRHWRLNNRP